MRFFLKPRAKRKKRSQTDPNIPSYEKVQIEIEKKLKKREEERKKRNE